uniref:SAM-dependent MTase RsmB/NOP-type domain-containing protein n=1 Tax=Mola mola TaxID=94237 RepID=A0A3Q3W544_MOLML
RLQLHSSCFFLLCLSSFTFADVYQLASVVFQNNHLERPATHRLVIFGKERGLPLPDVKEEEVQCAAFELAFNTLKCECIGDCASFCLVAVLLFDFQDRKFLPRKRKAIREVIQEVRDKNQRLQCFVCVVYRHKTRLAASLARYRIKYKLPSIEFILPESMKTKEWRSKRLPLYAWVNTLKSSLDEVQQVLKSEGFLQVKSIGQLEGQTFCRDSHCGDILVLPAHMKTQLCSTKLLTDHKIVIQDKSYSLGPNVVCSLLPEEGDVLMVGCFSGLTVSHTASLIAQKHKASGNYQPTVYVCVSNCTNTQRAELQKIVITMGCNNVKLIPEDFLSLYGHDKRFQRLCVILLTPKCSMSAVSNPIEVIVTEKGGKQVSELQKSMFSFIRITLTTTKNVDNAHMFCVVPKVLSVVYSTCSSYPEENEEVVNKALEQVKTDSEKQENPKHTLFRSASASLPHSLHLSSQVKSKFIYIVHLNNLS